MIEYRCLCAAARLVDGEDAPLEQHSTHCRTFNEELAKRNAPALPSILDEAARLTNGDRPAAYGHPFDDYTATADMWSAMLRKAGLLHAEAAIPPDLAALMMVALKLSRLAGNLSHRDSAVDAVGYLSVWEKIRDRRAQLWADGENNA